MNDKLNKALTYIRDEMVEEDSIKEQNSENLSQITEKKILNKAKKQKFNLKGVLNKKLIGLAASIVVVISAFIIMPYALNGFGAKSTKKDLMVESRQNMKADSKMDTSKENSKAEESEIDSDNFIFPINQDDKSQKIVYRFFYDIQTRNFKNTESNLKKLVNQTKGYISNADIFMNGRLMRGEFLIRVPKENSTKFQESINGLGTVISQNLSSEDLTKQYRDLEADKLTQDIKEKKLQELLKEAKNFEDIIKIQGELSKIESIKIQLKKQLSEIDHDVDYQYFTISLTEVEKTDDPVGKKVTFLDNIKKQFLLSLTDFVNFIEGLALMIIRNWILVLIVIIVIIFAFNKFKKSRF